MKSRPLPVLFLVITAYGPAGCEAYRPSPLDLSAYGRTWSGRDAAGANVMSFARRALSSPDGAARYDPADGLTLREAEAVALFFNPQLRAARLRAKVAGVGAAEAGRWEDPVLGVDAERILASVAEPWVLAGTVGFTLPISGRLAAEKRHAAAEADVERLRVLVEERAAITALRQEWLQWSATLERVEVTAALVKELGDVAAVADRLRQAGELAPAAARLFEIERVTQQSRVQALEAEARDGELAVRARLGLTPQAPLALVPQMYLAAPADVHDTGTELVPAAHPRLHLARAQYEVAERALRLEIRKQYPDLGVEGGYGTDEGDERALLGGSIPLPLLNANRRGIAEARANREAARASAEAEYQELASTLARARAKAEAAARRLEFVTRELAPLGDRQLDEVRRLARLGDFDAIALYEALKAAHETKLELLQAQLDASLANSRLNSFFEISHREVRP